MATPIIEVEVLVRYESGEPALWVETADDGSRTLNDYNGASPIWPGTDIDAAAAQWKATVGWYIPCAYCGAELTDEQNEFPTPAEDDDEAWADLATAHADGCEWIVSRSHRRAGRAF